LIPSLEFSTLRIRQCSNFGNHRYNQHLPMFSLRNDHADSCYCRNGKETGSGSGHVFPQIFHSGSDKQAQNPTGVNSCTPVSSEISDLRNSDFTPCTHAQSNILRIKYAVKTDDYGFVFRQVRQVRVRKRKIIEVKD